MRAYAETAKVLAASADPADPADRELSASPGRRSDFEPGDAAAQAKAYGQQLGVPYAFLSNGDEGLFWEWQREACPRPVKTIFKHDDLERRIATLSVRRDPASSAIDKRIAGRNYQIECIDALCREIGLGRRKLLVEAVTGTQGGRRRCCRHMLRQQHLQPPRRGSPSPPRHG